MTNEKFRFRFMERILHLLHMFEEKNLEIDQIFESSLPSDLFSAEETAQLHTVLEYIYFMEELPGGFFIYYADGGEELLYANRGTLRMFQCDTLKEFRELTGNSFRGMVHPDDLDAIEHSIRRQLRLSQHYYDYVEYRIRRKDGSVCWVDDYGHLVHRGTERDLFCVFIKNLSEERVKQQARLTQQIQVLTENFEKADLDTKAKNAFLSQISHEMRTPLNAIFGFTTLARTSLCDPGSIADYLTEIETASHQLLDMISKALDASALSGADASAEEECRLPALFQEIYDSLLPQAQKKNLAFTLDYGTIIHPNVYTVSNQLRLLVQNLVSNAITYTEAGGTVTVSLTEETSTQDNISVYRLEVQDNGIGMEESFSEHIFEPFSREKTSTFNGIYGIGLGLTIVKGIVNLMGGTISVKTALEEGSTFTVTLPFRFKPDTAAQNTEAQDTIPLHILLVEDNDLNREIETSLLEANGFIVDPVNGGRIALEKVTNAPSSKYDLILLDLQMPDMNGWQVASTIRKLPDPALAHIPIIALSANVQIADRHKSLESGIDVHLSKPMDLKLLLETIEKIT